MGMFKCACRPAKTDPAERVLTPSLPPPTPSSKKNIHDLHKNVSPSRLPHPGRISDHVLAPSGTCISNPPVTSREQRPRVPHTKHNPTCVRAWVRTTR